MNSISAFKKNADSMSEPIRSENRNISIWIDDYDDLFSDFDPRPLSDRNISDDFLYEVKKISRENEVTVNEFRLLIPKEMRKKEDEDLIVKRLHLYFRNNHHAVREQIKDKNLKGILLAVTGILLMITASYIAYLKSTAFYMQAAFVVAEPAGWFLLWSGLDSLIYASKDKKTELEFYSKISKAKISFASIENQK